VVARTLGSPTDRRCQPSAHCNGFCPPPSWPAGRVPILCAAGGLLQGPPIHWTNHLQQMTQRAPQGGVLPRSPAASLLASGQRCAGADPPLRLTGRCTVGAAFPGALLRQSTRGLLGLSLSSCHPPSSFPFLSPTSDLLHRWGCAPCCWPSPARLTACRRRRVVPVRGTPLATTPASLRAHTKGAWRRRPCLLLAVPLPSPPPPPPAD